MKHNYLVIGIVIGLFVLAQIIGVMVLNNYIDVDESVKQGKTIFRDVEVAGSVLERPDVDESQSFAYMALGVLIGTLILLMIARWNLMLVWKLWFFLATMLCLSIAFGGFIINSYTAFVLGALVAFYKVFRPNVFVQNISELFMYGGLAVIFVPIMNLFSAIALLILISAYDMYAVWKSRHMIELAHFQSKSAMFAGLMIPYSQKDEKTKIHAKAKAGKLAPAPKPSMIRNAVLGGGDVGFPLIFSGVVLKTYGLWQAYAIIPFTAIALLILFLKGENEKFYPAMPPIAAGCLIGLGIVAMLS